MDKNTHAREAQLRAISIYEKRPERAQVVNRGTAEVLEGLGCIYEQDGQRLSVDMPKAIGGSEEAPPPGCDGGSWTLGMICPPPPLQPKHQHSADDVL